MNKLLLYMQYTKNAWLILNVIIWYKLYCPRSTPLSQFLIFIPLVQHKIQVFKM